MDNVEVFDSAIEAMHKVKELIGEIDQEFETVYLAYCEYNDRWYVTDDSYDLGRVIHDRWGGDGNPENESGSWKVWEYMMAVKKEKYSRVYRKAKRTVIQTIIPMIRMERSVGCEYSVDFKIE